MSLDMQHMEEHVDEDYPSVEQIAWEMSWDEPASPEEEEILAVTHGETDLLNTVPHEDEAWYVNKVMATV